MLATAGMDQKIKVVDISKNFKEIWSLNSKDMTNYLTFIEKYGYICGGTESNDINIYSLKSEKLVTKFKNHSDSVNLVKSSEDNTLISASQDRTIKLWDL